MFGSSYFPDDLTAYNPAFPSQDHLGLFLSQFASPPPDFPMKDFLPLDPFLNLDDPDHTQFLQMLDQNFQNFPEEFRQWFQYPMDCFLPQPLDPAQVPVAPLKTNPSLLPSNYKIGSLTIDERRIKVKRFLEKRKTRSFLKKISYMCRKNVADKRVRIKGRFVSKLEAEKILGEKAE